MPDTPANNELLRKILERLDQLDEKFTGEIRSVQGEVQSVRGEVQSVRERVDQLDEKFTGEIQAVNTRLDQLDEKFTGETQAVNTRLGQLDEKFTGEIQAVNTRLGQLDEKFTGEIRQLDQKFTGEIQAARKEAREFHNASQESVGHLQRVVENEARKRVAFEQKMDRRWDEQQRLWLEILDGIRRTMAKDDQRMLNDEEILARLEKEIEELKKDKSAKDLIIEEFTKDRLVKDATIRDLQQRISRLETAQNIAN